MDWQTFIQWFFIVASGASIFGTFLAWASRKNGKETREFLKETREFLSELIIRMNEMAEQRHKEVVELLKTGFGEVLGKIK